MIAAKAGSVNESQKEPRSICRDMELLCRSGPCACQAIADEEKLLQQRRKRRQAFGAGNVKRLWRRILWLGIGHKHSNEEHAPLCIRDSRYSFVGKDGGLVAGAAVRAVEGAAAATA